MGTVIQKYGGSSVADIDRIRTIAHKIVDRKREGDRVVVVVSAMANTTDELLGLANDVTDSPTERELDMLLTAGERISMALLSMAICGTEYDAISFTGSQSGIITDNNHNRAKIIEINAFRLVEELEKDKIVIVAGFQGVSPLLEVTTLGRGGSDSTAVALAHALGANSCEIFTDVEGVYSIDPNISSNSIKFDTISHRMMLSLSTLGAHVVHPRAVELAKAKDIDLIVRSSFSNSQGTLITNKGNKNMEEPKIKAVTSKKNILFVQSEFNTMKGVNKQLKTLHSLRVPFEQIHLDRRQQKYLVSFWISKEDFSRVEGEVELDFSEECGILSLVGEKLSRKGEFVARGSELIEDKDVQIYRIFTTPTSITWLVKREFTDKLSEELHKEFIEQ